MSLLSSIPSTQVSKEDLLNLKVKRIKEFSRQAYQQLSHIQRQGIDMLWNDRKLTPQEIIDALGDEALKVFQMHGTLTTAIVDIATADGITPSVVLPTNAFEIVDGSIVVSKDPYTP